METENDVNLRQEIKVRKNLIGKQFGKLMVVSRADDIINDWGKSAAWNCECSCGKHVIVRHYYLNNGGTTSCGCIRKESHISYFLGKKDYDPSKSTAKDIYCSLYKDGDLTFEQFIDLSQSNCFYCGMPPSNQKKCTKNKRSKYFMDNSLFIYNGLDRVRSSIVHDYNNVVACCCICNRAKRERSLEDFIGYIRSMDNKNIEMGFEEYRDLSLRVKLRDLKEMYFGRIVKKTFSGNYSDGNLSADQFYALSQLNCYYCNGEPTNNVSGIKPSKRGYDNLPDKVKSSAIFTYNGLDRIDSSGCHDYCNIIPCCKWCNYAKRDYKIGVFIDWMRRLKNNYENLIEKAKGLEA